jgi:hypothetical protein
MITSAIRYTSALLLLLLLLSCEEQTDWTFQPLENGALAVDALITDEFKRHEILLSLSYDELNGEPLPATDAEVGIVGGGQTHLFRPDVTMPGRYVSWLPFAAKPGIPYTLVINWRGETYEAENTMIEVLPFKQLTFQSAGEDSLRIGEVAPQYLPYEQAMYEVDIVWSHLVNREDARAKLFYYTFSTIDINQLFRPEKETLAFPKGSIVVERKYSLNPEFAAYLRAMLMETEWQGGVFDEASGSLPTNISNGGLGFFAVCAVKEQTFIAQ